MSRRVVLLVLAIVVAPYFVRLGTPDLWDVNETLYAEPPREALETGEWLVPTMNYEPWFVKPPGVTWITLPFYAWLGPNELAARLPMALAAALVILLTWRIGTSTAGGDAGLLAAVVLATTAKNFEFSRQLAGDVYLTLSLVIAMQGYLQWFCSSGAMRRGLWVAAVSVGLGTLMKGPIALLLPAAFVPLHLWVAGRLSLWRRLRPLGPGLLALALAIPWFAYASWRYGDGFLSTYFGWHHFARFLTGKLGSRSGLWYPPVFLADILPWGAALPGACWLCFRNGIWRREPWLSAWLWCAFVLVFFSLSAGKREVYLLPIYPFAALLIGATMDHLLRQAAGWRCERLVVGPLLPVAVLVVALGVWVAVALPELRLLAVGMAALGGVWAGLLTIRLRRHDGRGALFVTAGAAVCTALWVAANQDVLQAERPAREFAQYVNGHATAGDRSGRYLVGLHSLSFYGRRPYFSVRDPDALRAQCQRAPHTWVVMPAAQLDDIAACDDMDTAVALRRTYLQVSFAGLFGGKPLQRTLLLVKVTPQKR